MHNAYWHAMTNLYFCSSGQLYFRLVFGKTIDFIRSHVDGWNVWMGWFAAHAEQCNVNVLYGEMYGAR
jgi:hypothetical protein